MASSGLTPKSSNFYSVEEPRAGHCSRRDLTRDGSTSLHVLVVQNTRRIFFPASSRLIICILTEKRVVNPGISQENKAKEAIRSWLLQKVKCWRI